MAGLRLVCLLDVEPRQSGRRGFTKPVRRAGAGHRVRSSRPARSGLPSTSAPLGFEAPPRPDCLGSTRSHSSSSHRWHGCLAWRFFVALLAKRKILRCCYSRACPAHARIAIGPGMRRDGVVLVWKICLARVDACQDDAHFISRANEIVAREIFCSSPMPKPSHADHERYSWPRP